MEPFLKFTEYILGDRVFGIQIPAASGEASQQKGSARMVDSACLRTEAQEKRP